MVEHYFHPYGGYSPNPVVFLAAAAQVTRHARLVTGAVLPAFNNPLKIAGELGMLDALSDGRLEHRLRLQLSRCNIDSVGVKFDESRAILTKAWAAGRQLLLKQENVTSAGSASTIFATSHAAATHSETATTGLSVAVPRRQ